MEAVVNFSLGARKAFFFFLSPLESHILLCETEEGLGQGCESSYKPPVVATQAHEGPEGLWSIDHLSTDWVLAWLVWIPLRLMTWTR